MWRAVSANVIPTQKLFAAIKINSHRKLVSRRRLLEEQTVVQSALWCEKKVYAMWQVPHRPEVSDVPIL